MDSGERESDVGARQVSRRNFLKMGGTGLAGVLLLQTAGCVTETGSQQQEALRAAYQRPIESLDPHGAFASYQGTLIAATNMYDTLVVRKENVLPSLATEWEQPDPRTWVFTLREGVKFHDGSTLTAKDVTASIERFRSPENVLAPLFESVDNVEATDEQTLTIKTLDPLGTLLSNLALVYILPADKMDDPKFFEKPIGSGPFQAESFVPSQQLTMTAYADYWDGAPKLERLELPYIPETSARMTGVETGEIGVTWSVPPDQVAQLEGSSEVGLEEIPSLLYYFSWFNCSREPFTDADVRRAMWHAVDTQTIIDDLFGNALRPIRAPLPSSVFGYAPQEPYEYDPELARRMLAEAGYGNGFSTSLIWPRNQAPQIRQFGETLISYWADVGVEVKGQELEEAEFVERHPALEWDMSLLTSDVLTRDADYVLGRLYTSEAKRLGYSNPQLDKTLVSARTTVDQEKRAELYAQACETLWEAAVGIFFGELLSIYALRSDVKGLEPDPLEVVQFHKVSLQSQ